MDTRLLTNLAIKASLLAGIQIREVYKLADFSIRLKNDQTPVTLADWNAHKEILRILEPSGLPVLSEEAADVSYQIRKQWETYWLVDPLDGTKEFIKRNDEFTVNIALMHFNKPIAGIIYAPITGELYMGMPGVGAFKYQNPGLDCNFELVCLKGEKLPLNRPGTDCYIVTTSRSHMNPETEAYIDRIRQKEVRVKQVTRGSSLKICMVAEGSANIYPKLGKTMEWDTAAGHAIVKAVGKNIWLEDFSAELSYNKENLQNPHFIVR